MKKNKLKKYLKSFVIFTLVASLSVSISGCSKKEEFPLSLTNFCFDTTITITIYEYAGESEAQDIINECFGLCNHYDKMFSTTKKDSDISKINQSKTKGCKVNHVVSDVIKDSIKYSKKSKGAFDVTIGELSDMWNVTGDNPTVPDDKKIKEAVNVAQATEFVEKMDGTYNASIAQGGTNVSGGQKQRLSIARAIARDPEIYIFDDSFSALDYKTDTVLRRELKKYTKEATILIVAQRVGTIINADKIVVLDNGKIVGLGTHKELLKNCEVYQQIATSQLSKEELENG